MITSTGAYSCAQVEFLFERAASIKVEIISYRDDYALDTCSDCQWSRSNDDGDFD